MKNIPETRWLNAWVVIPVLTPVKKEEKGEARKKAPFYVFIR